MVYGTFFLPSENVLAHSIPLRFSYRSWDRVPFACVQELREAIGKFRESAGEVAKDGEGGGKHRRFAIAVADTFGEGGPVSGKRPPFASVTSSY